MSNTETKFTCPECSKGFDVPRYAFNQDDETENAEILAYCPHCDWTIGPASLSEYIGDHFSVGDYVTAHAGTDSDVGRIREMPGDDTAEVGWSGGVVTTLGLSSLSLITRDQYRAFFEGA